MLETLEHATLTDRNPSRDIWSHSLFIQCHVSTFAFAYNAWHDHHFEQSAALWVCVQIADMDFLASLAAEKSSLAHYALYFLENVF